ncbi:DUF1871 family protein [Bacillus massilinigeriensis]|uniref:DUF1871 family protein n=1 Tax=Bacillus mediterraneensis TaxID=1805474 RepID=UPI0009F5458B|nr:DUF1871 family protein [Bacillus mediterraneensis]
MILETQDKNRQMVKILNEWDPIGCGYGMYDPEIAGVLHAVYNLDSQHELAIRIQAVYEHSFEEIIPYESCLLVAKSLLAVKSMGNCSI